MSPTIASLENRSTTPFAAGTRACTSALASTTSRKTPAAYPNHPTRAARLAALDQLVHVEEVRALRRVHFTQGGRLYACGDDWKRAVRTRDVRRRAIVIRGTPRICVTVDRSPASVGVPSSASCVATSRHPVVLSSSGANANCQ